MWRGAEPQIGSVRRRRRACGQRTNELLFFSFFFPLVCCIIVFLVEYRRVQRCSASCGVAHYSE